MEKTNITFEYDVPSVEEMTRRIEETLKQYPYLVIEESGQILGYAYASRYHSRQAYQWDCELSVYIDEKYHGKGLAKQLYQALLMLLKMMNIQNVYACITHPNIKSENFHHKLGFTVIGCFHQAGYKFEKWHDVVWMEKSLSDKSQVQEVIPFCEISSTQIELCLHNSCVQEGEFMV